MVAKLTAIRDLMAEIAGLIPTLTADITAFSLFLDTA